MNGRSYDYGFGNASYQVGPIFQRYLRELQTLPTEEEEEDTEELQRAAFESISNSVREKRLAIEKGRNEDETLARALQEEEDEYTATYIGKRDQSSSYDYEQAKNNRESRHGGNLEDREEGYIFGSGPDGLNFANISPTNRTYTVNNHLNNSRTTHNNPYSRNNIVTHNNVVHHNSNNIRNSNTTVNTTTTTGHHSTTTTTSTSNTSHTTANNRRERPQRQWGIDNTVTTLNLQPENQLGASRAPVFTSNNSNLFSTNYLSARSNLSNFRPPPLPTFPSATPSATQPRRGPAYLQQDIPQHDNGDVHTRRAPEPANNRATRQTQTAGVPLVHSPPQLSSFGQSSAQDVNNPESVGLTDEEYALMLQREETLNFRRLLGEELAGSLTDEDILNVPVHDIPPFYMPHAHDDSGDEYYSDSEDEVNLDDMTYEELLALGDRIGTVSKGASKSQIAQCPQRRYEGERTTKEKSCSICQEDFEQGVMLRFLPCTHCYHSNCIDQWLAQQSKCPVCQYSIKDGN